MDFFAAQDKARKRTGRLVLYFVLALFLIIAVLYTVGMIIFNVGLDQQGGSYDLLNWPMLGVVTLFCVVVIGGGSLFKILQLSSGGSVVALSLGGRLIDPDGADADERRVLNVVEEMAIASGVPVPPVYLVEDDTINAFAAGYKSTDAVIGVTRGCVERLDRDQLQGVMAHEYSHIFNGDMRLNIRLVGVIHGLLVMGVIGYYIMRTAAFSGGGRRSSNNKNGGGAGAILLVGLAMMAVGFIGTFFGRLIQSAVSRQREFLADASAVQYTRNPDGIAGALRVIGGLKKKSDMPSTASEYNHMFFAQAMHSIFASHPPLGERIARIEGIDAASLDPATSTSTAGPSDGMAVSGFASDVPSSAVHAAVESIGQVNEASIRHVGHVLDSIPDSIRAATHDPWGARLVVLALLLPIEGSEKQRAFDAIAAHLDDGHLEMLRNLHGTVRNLHPMQRLPLIDLSIPALTRMSRPQYDRFMEMVGLLIRLDGQVDLFEWCMHTTLEKHLGERFDARSDHPVGRRRLRNHLDEVALVIATVARVGAEDPASGLRSWEDGMAGLGIASGMRMPDATMCTLRTMRTTLSRLGDVRFEDRKRLLQACEIVIDHDGTTTVEEAQLLRVIADSLDCPMPPIIPGPA